MKGNGVHQKTKVVVIADDITGAAEIAGIAYEQGLRVRLLCAYPMETTADHKVCRHAGAETTTGTSGNEDCDVIVIASDTRSMTEDDAAKETQRITSFIAAQAWNDAILFKKTDSALRGHVIAELEALLQTTDYEHALYIPANPSKERIIKDGVYYVGEQPIADTDFSFDPEFPAVSSDMRIRFPQCEEKNIWWEDATSAEDIRQRVKEADSHTLLAGAADLFSALLTEMGFEQGQESIKENSSDVLQDFSVTDTLTQDTLKKRTALIVCGSTQSKPLHLGIAVCPMPLEVYDHQAEIRSWTDSLVEKLQSEASHSLILTIPHRHRTGKAIAIYLRKCMGEVTQRLVMTLPPQELIIEGGATAFEILLQLGWHEFDITDVIAPGVVRMHAVGTDTHVTMKPGSYSWGNLLK